MFERIEPLYHNMEKEYKKDDGINIEMLEESMMRYRAFIKRLKKLNVKGKYMEIGSGSGILAVALARENPDIEITAMEVSRSVTRSARKYAEKNNLQEKIHFIEGDAGSEKTIGILGKFDLIYSTYSLHHWKDPVKVIRNCFNALTEDGVFFIHDLRRAWWLYCMPFKDGFFNSIRAAYNKTELISILRSADVKQYQIQNDFPFMLSVICKK
jgi:2-polyprenyl-3-methyl-5-hydroxy-6-metoxy-1,4-benzoquinol methylase